MKPTLLASIETKIGEMLNALRIAFSIVLVLFTFGTQELVKNRSYGRVIYLLSKF